MHVRRTSRRALIAAVSCVAATVPVALLTAAPAFADATITTPGPLSSILTTRDLNCAVNEVGDASGEWYGDTACGTFLALGTKRYGPASVPAGISPTPWRKVSQSAVTGTGVDGDPYAVTTNVAAATTGVTLAQTDSYVSGAQSYRTDMTVTNGSASAQTVILYRAGDCYFSDSDTGFGSVADGLTPQCVAPSFSNPAQPGTRIESMIPLTAGSHYKVGTYSDVWQQIGLRHEFADECQCTTADGAYDNGLGLSWQLTLDPGASSTVSASTYFSPPPLRTTVHADDIAVVPGQSDGFTVNIANPTARDVTVDSITDTLPLNYSYTAGSTTGATTADPTVAGRVLTWAGPFVVTAGSNVSLHFAVTAPATQTDAANSASGVVSSPIDQTVAPGSAVVHVHPLAIKTVAPIAVALGTSGTFTIHGTTFHAGGTLTVSGTGVTITSLSVPNSTTLSAHYAVDPGAALGPRDVTFTDALARSATKTNAITVDPLPTVGSVTPSVIGQGAVNFPVVLTGTGFRAAATVTVAGVTVTKHFVNSGEIDLKLTVPAGHPLGNAAGTLANGDGARVGFAVTISGHPKVTAAAPAVAHGTTQTVTVSGSGFQAGLTVTGVATGITYGTPTNVTATSFDVDVTVAATRAAGTFSFTVINPDGGRGSAKVLQVT